MGFRDHGYYGYAFLGTRPIEIVSLVAVIGMTGHFVSQDSHARLSAPSQIVATLVVSSLALLWTLLSFTAYDETHIAYIVTSAVDLAFMIPFIVVAAILGTPLSAATCSALPVAAANNTAELLAFQVRGSANTTAASDYILFVGYNQTTCYTIMAAWGLMIALCILFALSGLAAGLLFLGKRRAAAAAAGFGAGGAGGGANGNSEAGFELGSAGYAGNSGKAVSDYSESYHVPDSPPLNPIAAPPPTMTTMPALYPPSTVSHVPIRTTVGLHEAAVVYEDDDEDDDDDDDDEHATTGHHHHDKDDDGSNVTTPLSPPPPTHQAKTGLAGVGGGGGAGSHPMPLSSSPAVAVAVAVSTAAPTSATSASASIHFHPGPPVVVMPLGAGGALSPSAFSPTATTATAPKEQPLTRSLTNRFKASFAGDNSDTTQSRFREARESKALSVLWPRAALPFKSNAAVAVGTDNAPSPRPLLSPPLPPLPPSSPSPTTAPGVSASRSVRRKTLLQRIEGWWDLGLLRGGTIRGRGPTTTTLTTADAERHAAAYV